MKNIWEYKNKNPFSEETPAWCENEMIQYIFDRIQEKYIIEKKCIDFGANNGRFLSNTFPLIKSGWKSIQIESNSEIFNSLVENYKHNENVICLNKEVSANENSKDALDNIIDEYWKDSQIDFISIDVDGCDFSIFKTIKKYFPKLLIIENNSHLASYRNEGITTITNYANTVGYELLGYTGNLILIKKEYLEILDLETVSPEIAYKLFLENSTDEGRAHQTRIVDINNFFKQ